MGVGLLIGFLILIILIVVAIILLVYSLKRKSKVGLGCSTVILIFVILVFSANSIDEIMLDKEDIRNDLKFLNVELSEDFEILDNKITGMPEFFQETELKISNKDALKIITLIKSSKNFVDYSKIKDNNQFLSNSKSEIKNYRYPEFYSREFYGEVNNIATRFTIYIKEGSNKIEYKKFED